MPHSLITVLLDRVARHRDEGDTSALFEDTALPEAARLRSLMVRNDGAVDIEALDALVTFHMTRHQVRPGDNGYADYGEALRLLLLRARLLPADVPETFHEAVEEAGRRAYEAHQKALRLIREYERTIGTGHPDAAALDEAVGHYRVAVGLALGGPDIPGLPLSHLSTALFHRFELGGRTADLDEAIRLREASITYTAEENPELSRRLMLLSTLLTTRYQRTGRRPDLERAVSAGREAVDATPVDSHARARRLHHLAFALYLRYEHTYDLADLQEACDRAREAVESAWPDDPDRLDFAASLTHRLSARYDRLGDPADLDSPLRLLRSLLATAPEAQRAKARAQLAWALLWKHERTGELADLESAIAHGRQALDATAPTDRARGRRLAEHANAYRIRYERLDAAEDLQEAIRLGAQAVSATAEDPIALQSLARSYLLRYRRTFEQADLDRAVRLLTRALDVQPAASPDSDRAVAMGDLADALKERYDNTFDPAVLDEAVKWKREATRTVPRSHERFGEFLSLLSRILLLRFEQTGNRADVEEAIETAEQAVAATAPAHHAYGSLLGGLAVALAAGHGRQRDALDRPVALARQAVATARADDVFQPRAWRRLGDLLRRRYQHTGDRADLHEAVECWRRADAMPYATQQLRMECRSDWGRAGVELGDLALATDGYHRALLLLPELAWHGLPRTARERHLTDWSGIASTAAACHILAGAPERALELLEQGRTVVHNQLLRTRSDLSRLAERAPALADRMRRVRERLDTGRLAADADPAEMSDAVLVSPLARERVARERAELCREWDELLAEARGLDGFERFLAPVPYEDLRTAADGGPVVVVNVSPIACHALVVRGAPAPVEVVELPGLTDEAVTRRVLTFLNVLANRRRPQRPFLRREEDRHAVHDLLEWLWDSIAEPVLDRVGIRGATDREPPRLWWCPTGRLALLPLHAAGRYPRHGGAADPGGARSVPDRVVSSYASTLTALRRARQGGARGGSFGGLVVVGVPQAPGLPVLPAVERECAQLLAGLPAGVRAVGLLGRDATRGAVRQALHEHAWVHFACHAEQDERDPAASSLALYDGRLTAAELLELELPQAELAYLSACETAFGAVNLPDEAMHLASTLQAAGYRHAIATMWEVQDGSAADVAARVYATLTGTGVPDAAGAARALHAAVAAQRVQDPTDPLRWAAYLHVGP
ncbi:CHAT domain-containing protein [Streptomyces sp. ISL-22]|uniref:CHAT domain-containing tetratricopeptide repeat protein n=1 Tax=unclassified Streptomyces TaxID=2593676 RepID=UPI001BECDA59|nr:MULTISPECIES: CHAT domain-containing protein [unclassified Streptomyces]MBT2422853.1 CHAT domain-containing protein [Streptomyces sp. ISL-24]MBT2431066.1 CHAT domain-containing protein [Streptomyces sp. ISL-22]